MPLIRFWYRQAPRYLLATRWFEGGNIFLGMVTRDDPPQTVSRMTYIELDTQARLLHLEVAPLQIDERPSATTFDWNLLLAAASLDPAKLTATEPKWVPPAMSDARAAWIGTWPGSPRVPLRVEAAAWRGQPVYFEMIGPWTIPKRMDEPKATPDRTAGGVMGITFLSLLMASVYLAHRNVRLGRGDQRGALRLSAFVSITVLTASMLAAHHVPSSEEFALIFTLLPRALLSGAIVWLFYVALEPYIRRQWPQTLIGWNRVLAGGWRDPLVGADIPIGITGGAMSGVLVCLDSLLRMHAGFVPTEVNERLIAPLIGPRMAVASWLFLLSETVNTALWILLFICLLRVLVRKSWAAAAVCIAFLAGMQIIRGGSVVALEIAIWILTFTIGVTTLMRFGVLAFAAGILSTMLLWNFPVDLSRWYTGISLCMLLSVMALALFAFHTTLAGRPLIKDELFS